MANENLNTPAPLSEITEALPVIKIDHVSIAVRRIRDVLPMYRGLLQGELVDGGDHLEQGYRWIQFIYPGSTFKIELIEPIEDGGFLDRFLDQRGPGFHHILVYVSDLPKSIELVKAAGYEVVKTELNETGWSESFIHPKSNQGVLVELGYTDRDVLAPQRPEDFPHSLDDILNGKLGGRVN